MFIFKDTQKRANPYASYTDADGTYHLRIPADLLEEIPDPVPPADYSDETYYRTEQEDAPYIIFTKKSDDEIAKVRWNKISAIRDDKTQNGGCKVGDYWFHSDTHSKLQQLALFNAGANLPPGLEWKTMDGSKAPMTPELATQLFFAQMIQEQSIFAFAEYLKVTPEADITVGWPETYTPVVQE